MSDDDSLLSDLTDESSGDGEPAARRVLLFLKPPAKNSVEHELVARSYAEPALAVEMEWDESSEDDETPQVGREGQAARVQIEPDEMDTIRQELAEWHAARIALARSLQNCTWAAFNKAAESEGLSS